MENPIKMDDLGGPPLFLETPMYQYIPLGIPGSPNVPRMDDWGVRKGEDDGIPK